MINFTRIFKGNKSTASGLKLQYPITDSPVIEFWKVVLPPNSQGDWHEHLVPEFFYVESGSLYVTNKQIDDKLDVTIYKTGDVGLTDLNMAQFIWNPTDDPTVVLAIYLGASGINPTKTLNSAPKINKKLLEILMQQHPIENKSKDEIDLIDI